jgi:prevent-host-death family protein
LCVTNYILDVKYFTSSEANGQFSRILREVRGGETVIVTSHGQAVAKILPAGADAARAEAMKRLFARLDAQPVLNLPRICRDEMEAY